MVLKSITIVRHGETAWTLTGQHTSFTDLELTPKGREEARAVGEQLKNSSFNKIWTSPSKRAQETARIAGFSPEVDPDIIEWNYGDYEGRTSREIHTVDPGWTIFSKDPPHGESADQITKRVDRFLKKASDCGGDVAIFSSGHISRALAARFLGFPVSSGKHFSLASGSISILSFEHEQPVVKLWNYKKF